MLSIHEYELAEGKTAEEFRQAVREAEERGLFDLDGLAGYRFLRGVKGARQGKFTALWCWESRDAWKALWGPVGDPKPPVEYPERWKEWEKLLEPLLTEDPDEIRFTSYRTLETA